MVVLHLQTSVQFFVTFFCIILTETKFTLPTILPSGMIVQGQSPVSTAEVIFILHGLEPRRCQKTLRKMSLQLDFYNFHKLLFTAEKIKQENI